MVSRRLTLVCLFVAALACKIFPGISEGSTITTMPNAPFSWGSFGLNGGNVAEFRKPDGRAGGTIISFKTDVFDNDPEYRFRVNLVYVP